MLFTITKSEQEILDVVRLASRALGSPAYLVGGFVRDRLLARTSKDMDIVCVGDGITLAREVAGHLRPIPRLTVYKRFGTAMLRHNDTEIEFVGARKESYRSDSRKPAVEQGSLEDDQNRRDFTINALAVSLNDDNYGEIIDPFNGLVDLEEKRLRTPLDPGKTFTDDPLRMMRAIRFSNQLDFEIEDETFEAISLYRNRIQIVSQERITLELNKILETSRPSKGFLLLYRTGLLELIFPEIANLQGVEVVKGVGHKDNFYHTLKVLDNLAAKSDNLWLRWAALLHDVAKPATKRFTTDAGWTFHGHEALGAAMVPRIFRRLRLPLDQKMKYVQNLVRLHLRPISLTNEDITDSAIRRLLFEAGDDLEDLMLLCEADITSKNESKVHRYLRNYELVRQKLKEVEDKDSVRNWQPPIKGELIMEIFNIKPSREVGDIKKAIKEAILDGKIANNFNEAFEFMLDKGRELGLEPVSTERPVRDVTKLSDDEG
ncbi:MAG: CCA tRNA nucleotidyltransferase [Saprospiraceae bacterium]|nr:CCA tRNA nucleotidyltransferase [Saprospiraceae bacterium]